MAQNDATEHEHGTMDIREHEKMFAGFVKFATWSAVLSLGVLVFLALTNA
ncbi:aa3 type cytochrome c oxidase subunit IV [Paracoccus isoporae]|uniref:Aa3 type cytochrome c oxidase subunit IV n=1 Tax=Paracoccus isoporae TaxID=591205 RepID=A0A1G6Z1S9_9RHOB|nr:aa3-type cytochrome c oxidase subunit IV [Paracoccus isoporae]SDD96558.1 aa3 type cytochrome c oxidase subunit IV [Paracoccus isoporae]